MTCTTSVAPSATGWIEAVQTELLPGPLPAEYGELLLPMNVCRSQLSLGDDVGDDDLIEVLRDASIDYVEQSCSLFLGRRTGVVVTAAGFPYSGRLGMDLRGPSPVVTAIEWLDTSGSPVIGTISDFHVGPRAQLLPAIGGRWPDTTGGGVRITFDAGYEPGAAPAGLLAAARLFLGHLYLNRESVIVGAPAQETPLGVRALCDMWRRMTA